MAELRTERRKRCAAVEVSWIGRGPSEKAIKEALRLEMLELAKHMKGSSDG